MRALQRPPPTPVHYSAPPPRFPSRPCSQHCVRRCQLCCLAARCVLHLQLTFGRGAHPDRDLRYQSRFVSSRARAAARRQRCTAHAARRRQLERALSLHPAPAPSACQTQRSSATLPHRLCPASQLRSVRVFDLLGGRKLLGGPVPAMCARYCRACPAPCDRYLCPVAGSVEPSARRRLVPRNFALQ